MATKERLDLIIKELGLSGRAFEKECGLANGSYASIRDGVGADKLNKILIRFPHISAEWLLTGRGEMLKQTDDSQKTQCGDCSEIGESRQPKYPLNNKEEMKNVLQQMANLISGQQEDISKLITELQKNGQRSDRMLDLIEHEQRITHNADFKKKR